ncbi:MAG: heparinase II/III family protein [Candidatus Hydrogenedentes bacterium]|nr:heparinase II/III family protein [Candidatus Hydrogenedentota bacterium]
MNKTQRAMISALIGIVVTWSASGENPHDVSTPPVLSWGELLRQAESNAALDAVRANLVESAEGAAALPIYRRARTLAEVGQNRTWLDGRSESLEPEIREQFALAMSDFGACSGLAEELPGIAAGFRLTKDPALRDRIVVQLEEMATWSPLQRPGWTLYTPGHRLPPDGKDGNCVATGLGVRAIGDTFELLPEGTLNVELASRLHKLLEVEIAGVTDDWKTKRSWFIKTDNPNTNQWVLPTEGLVRACLILGVDRHREEYELGVSNLLRALDAHGPHGEFEEGFGYARFTVTSMLHTARAMAIAGDRRAIDHPFLKHFPTWFVHHFQPGDMVINCFDAGAAHGAAKAARPFLSLATMCTGSPVARWALANQVGGPSDDLAGLAARALEPVGPEAAPPLFAVYERAARVNWRDNWDSNATGVWVRGGHPLDQHDHQDRGHVNYISRGRPILVEAGTPSYSHKLMMTHYSSGVGHNVLQLGTEEPDASAPPGRLVTHPGWQKSGGVAPVTITHLDNDGGEVTLDGKACYDGIARWDRNVLWNAQSMTVTDDVALAEGVTNVVLLRWHLGTENEVAITGDAKSYTVTWPDARITLTTNEPLNVKQVKLPDNTLAGHTGDEDPKNFHTCLVVQTHALVSALRLTTQVNPA